MNDLEIQAVLGIDEAQAFLYVTGFTTPLIHLTVREKWISLHCCLAIIS